MLAEEKTLVGSAPKAGSFALANPTPAFNPKLSEVVPGFLKYGQYDLSWANETVRKYGECLNWVMRDNGNYDSAPLNKDMQDGSKEYLTGYQKDFFYVYKK